MHADVPIDLEELYVFEDSIVKNLIFDSNNDSIKLELIAPIFRRHPDYGGLFRRIRRYFSNSVYLNSDGRNLTIVFEGCKIKSKSKFDEDDDRASPINYYSFETKDDGSTDVVLKADDIEIEFCFKSLSHQESNISKA